VSSPQQPAPDPQAAQAGLGESLVQALELLWPLLALSALKDAMPSFKAAVAGLVKQHAQASATLEAVSEAVDWALAPLWSSAVPIAEFPGAPEETKRVASTAIADAKARLAAASEKLVLDTGRDTIVGNVQRDPVAKGWARLTEPDPCYFCAMLAARGAVYRSRKTAGFEAHDNCRCHVEPWFQGAYEPAAKVREWQRLYDTATAGATTSHDRRLAFRQAYEGREVNIKRDTVTKTVHSGKTTTTVRARGERTGDEIQAELTALENNLPRLANDQQREWTSKRMDTLRSQLGQQ
jgi:hypothetical protein